MRIAAATNNPNKILEIRKIIESHGIRDFEIESPNSLNVISDPNEDSDTLEGNARIKAISLFKKSGIPSFADDTGLFVEELAGKPGVHSARFASENANDSENRSLLLKLLKDKDNRKAYFETVICYISEKEELYFIGRCDGNISKVELGNKGFGYDSVFIPEGYTNTFAEIDSDLKNSISHRYKAVLNFVQWLKMNNQSIINP